MAPLAPEPPDEPALRRSTLALLCALGCGALGCGAPSAASRTHVPLPARDDAPLPPEANRNGPPPPEARPAIPGLTLWCSQPMGPTCTAASAELGTDSTPLEEVPLAHVRGARDLEDDCADPDLAPLMERVTAAVGVAVGGWTDQEGAMDDRSRLADLYTGSGCANAARPGDPPVKIQVVEIEGEPHFLVRVWEAGEARPLP